ESANRAETKITLQPLRRNELVDSLLTTPWTKSRCFSFLSMRPQFSLTGHLTPELSRLRSGAKAMASFSCHGFGVTKQVRLERIVRRAHSMSMPCIAFDFLRLQALQRSLRLATEVGPPRDTGMM